MKCRSDHSSQLWLDFSYHLPRYKKPITDNEKLLTYQAEWLEDQREDARVKLWTLMLSVATKATRGFYRKQGLRVYPDDVQDKASEAVWYIMRRYENPKTKCWCHDWNPETGRPGVMRTYKQVYGFNYCVTKDFLSVITQGVRHAVQYRTKAEGLVDYVDDTTLQRLICKEDEE